jgi:glutathionylspermidine synthase
MPAPLAAADPLPAAAWEAVRLRAVFDCCKWDVQSEDHCVLADFPMYLEAEAWQVLAEAAESLAREAQGAEAELLNRTDLHALVGLPRRARKFLKSAKPIDAPRGAARVIRFDFHCTTEGWRISEANADVPGGFIEASGFAELMAEHYPGYAPPANPANLYCDAIAAAAGERALIGLVHATAHSDDRQVMEYLARVLHSKGLRTLMLSPEHLRWEGGMARVASAFAAAVPALLVRFFPAEWLCDLRPRELWTPWFAAGKTPMSNPASALLIQSKRFPLAWPELNSPLDSWRRLLPETKSPDDLTEPAERDWVLKPIFGRVGEDVGIAGVTESRTYESIARAARKNPGEWAAQRRFEALPIETPYGPRHASLGIFTVDGRAAGAYGRIAAKALIDQEAQDVAVLVRR